MHMLVGVDMLTNLERIVIVRPRYDQTWISKAAHIIESGLS